MFVWLCVTAVAVLNFERAICLKQIITFENQLHQSKTGKLRHNFDIVSYFYIQVGQNSSKSKHCDVMGNDTE